MTLVDIQITPSTLQAYTTNNSYTIWMIGVFTEIRVSFTLDKYGKFLTLSDQLQAYDIDENHPNRILISCILLCEKNVVGAQVSRRHESPVIFCFTQQLWAEYARSDLHYCFTISCSTTSLSKMHLPLCLILCFSLERKGVYEEKKKKQGRWGIWKNLKERGRGPFNLEISKTHLICNSDLRCFHLFAVQIVIRFSRKEGVLLPCFHFFKATLRYRPILGHHIFLFKSIRIYALATYFWCCFYIEACDSCIISTSLQRYWYFLSKLWKCYWHVIVKWKQEWQGILFLLWIYLLDLL